MCCVYLFGVIVAIFDYSIITKIAEKFNIVNDKVENKRNAQILVTKKELEDLIAELENLKRRHLMIELLSTTITVNLVALISFIVLCCTISNILNLISFKKLLKQILDEKEKESKQESDKCDSDCL